MRLSGRATISPGTLRDLAAVIKEPVTLVGSGVEHYRDLIINRDSLFKIDKELIEAAPGGAAVACLAAVRLEQGKSDDVLPLPPLF